MECEQCGSQDEDNLKWCYRCDKAFCQDCYAIVSCQCINCYCRKCLGEDGDVVCAICGNDFTKELKNGPNQVCEDSPEDCLCKTCDNLSDHIKEERLSKGEHPNYLRFQGVLD